MPAAVAIAVKKLVNVTTEWIVVTVGSVFATTELPLSEALLLWL